MRAIRPLATSAALLIAVAGCAPDGGDETPSVDIEPAPLTGTFDVTSQFQVPATVAAPGPLGDTLRLVHGLAVDPGTTLLDFAEEAGVPALAELRLVLPETLESELTGWMNDYLETATVGGVSPHERIAQLDTLIRSVLLSWELRSTLSLPVDSAGTHAPVAIVFEGPAGPVVVPVDATAPVTSGMGITATLAWPDGPEGAAQATIGDHAMGIPFGRYALAALEAVLLAQYGAEDLHAFLAAAVGMRRPRRQRGRPMRGPVLRRPRDRAAHRLRGRRRRGGGAPRGTGARPRLRGHPLPAGDRQRTRRCPCTLPEVSALQDGVWTATIDLGQGAEAATATFVAVH